MVRLRALRRRSVVALAAVVSALALAVAVVSLDGADGDGAAQLCGDGALGTEIDDGSLDPADAEAWVDLVFTATLGRYPSGDELDAWTTHLTETGDRAALSCAIVASEPFADRYRRTSAQDLPAGTELEVGSIAELDRAVLGSDAFAAQYGTGEDLVTAWFERLVGRAPDAAELEEWSSQLAAEGTESTLEQLRAADIAVSASVDTLFTATTGRAPSPQESTALAEAHRDNDLSLPVTLAELLASDAVWDAVGHERAAIGT